jgi:outer membrane protein, heavy metal efflux system
VNRFLLILTALLPPLLCNAPDGAAAVPEGTAPGSSAEAAAPLPPADLVALLEEAEAGSPSLRAAQARLEAAGHLPSQSEAAPNPEVSLAYTNEGWSSFTLGETEMSILALTWTQELPYRGKLKKAGEVASFEAQRAGKEVELARLEVAAAVKSAFADLYRIDRTAGILDETHAVMVSLADAARRRYEVGEGIQESVLKAQTEILRLEAEQARVLQDRRAAEIRLNAAIGRTADTPIGSATHLPEAALPTEGVDLAEAAVTGSPEIGSLQAAVRRGESGVELARLNLKPDFIWSASYQNRGGFDPMIMGMFGVRLPIHRERKEAEAVLQKESELQAARHDLAGLEVRIRSTVRELISRAQRADRLLALFEQGVIPQAESTFESAGTSYRVGRLGLLDVLNDLTALLNARTEVAAQESERMQALAAIEPLLGRELISVPRSSAAEGGDHAGRR